MELATFRRIVTCFADRGDDVDVGQGELLVQIRDETITAKLHRRPDGLVVEEEGERSQAASWIVNRVARVPLLAERICTYVKPPLHFVTPAGRFLDHPDQTPSDQDSEQDDVVATLKETLGRRSGGITEVVYLTSDAGEGKTSLIDFLAVQQAEAYKEKKTDWLLVPIPLSGRAFLRFDDAVVSALVNRFRFQLLYYDAFLELVRLGVLVPAFDGFEEMIVESSAGEAISALGNLVAKLRSEGTLLVSARKAYFDYPSFGSQARLFDGIGARGDVAFGRVSLKRWDRSAFITYAAKMGVRAPVDLYAAVADRLGRDHPVLTRAVLVDRLVEVAAESTKEDGDVQTLVDRLGQEPQDYFSEFVSGLVEREAQHKWLDTSGDPPQAVLTTSEHHDLLAMLALEMWLSATDDLKTDVVRIIVDMFSETRKKSPAVVRQIGERITEHALLAKTGFSRDALGFDHEDFRVFYFGQALGRMLVENDVGEVRQTIERAGLPISAIKEAVRYFLERGGRVSSMLWMLQRLAEKEMPASFTKENSGALTLELVERTQASHEAWNMSFPAGSLRGRKLKGLTVSGSYFYPTSLADCSLENCRFVNCIFERIELDQTARVAGVVMDRECQIRSVVRVDGDGQFAQFDPELIRMDLCRAGFEVGLEDRSEETPAPVEPDADLRIVLRFLRAYLRANALNESTIRQRLGVNASHFFRSLLPDLIQAGVVEAVSYRGHGDQTRMKLSVPMSRIDAAIGRARGKFDGFVDGFREQER